MSILYSERLAEAGIEPSVGSVGDSYDKKTTLSLKRSTVFTRPSVRSGGDLAEKIAAIKDKRDRHKALLDELERTGENQISLTDPDARAMARMTKVGVGYNVQLAVDMKHKMIAGQEVSSQVLDMGLLAPTATAAITAYVPKPVRGPAVREGFFSKDEFRYDAAPGWLCLPQPAGFVGALREQVSRQCENRLQQP